MTYSGSVHIKSEDISRAPAQHPTNASAVIPVIFPGQFPTPPRVLLGLSGFEGGGEAFRFQFEPANITESGFELLLFARRSWIDAIDVSWLATDA